MTSYNLDTDFGVAISGSLRRLRWCSIGPDVELLAVTTNSDDQGDELGDTPAMRLHLRPR